MYINIFFQLYTIQLRKMPLSVYLKMKYDYTIFFQIKTRRKLSRSQHDGKLIDLNIMASSTKDVIEFGVLVRMTGIANLVSVAVLILHFLASKSLFCNHTA